MNRLLGGGGVLGAGCTQMEALMLVGWEFARGVDIL